MVSDRRRFILGTVRSAGLVALGGLVWSAYVDEVTASKLILRPPGAIKEDERMVQILDLIEQTAKELDETFYIVLDEFQDISPDGFALVEAIWEAHEGELRMIAVGDDDQCILSGVNKADVIFFKKYRERFGSDEEGYKEYALTINFRSDASIVSLANHMVRRLQTRFKTESLIPYAKASGRVVLHLCESPYLVRPAVEQVKTVDPTHSVAVLAHTNEEVSALYSALYDQGIQARYLLDRGGFRLRNLEEIDYVDFHLKQLCGDDHRIDEEYFEIVWEKSKRRFQGSLHLKLLKQVIDGFRKEYDAYYLSLWESYLDEITFEDFSNSARVTVSTMHKAKGKEFDTVIVVIHPRHIDDELLRLYYVAVTRAKKELIIMTDHQRLLSILPNDLTIIKDHRRYAPTDTQTSIMTLRNVALGFSGWQNDVSEALIAGTKVTMRRMPGSDKLHLFVGNDPIERLSKEFDKTIKERLKAGYRVVDIEVESVVLWKDKKENKRIKHALCKIVMKK